MKQQSYTVTLRQSIEDGYGSEIKHFEVEHPYGCLPQVMRGVIEYHLIDGQEFHINQNNILSIVKKMK